MKVAEVLQNEQARLMPTPKPFDSSVELLVRVASSALIHLEPNRYSVHTVLPKLGVAGSSPIMNVEPVVALVLAWLLLGQSIAAIQVVGALIVVGAVMWLGLRKR